jgi:hypothetical protein
MALGPITTDALALRLGQRLQARGVPIDDVTVFAAEFSPDLTAWMGGEGAIPADLSQKFATAVGAWNTDIMQRLDSYAGAIDGGPDGDGIYPLTDAAGNTRMVPCIAKVLDSAAKGNAGWSPKLTSEADGATRVVWKVTDWTGGQGTKPVTGYIAADGSTVETAAAAYDFFGPISAVLTGLKSAAEGSASTALGYRNSAAASRDEVRLVADRSNESFFALLSIIASLEDTNGRGVFLTEDGKFRGDLGVDAGVNLTRSYNAELGITTFSLTALTAPLAVSSGGTIEATTEQYTLDQLIMCGLFDSADRFWAAGLQDGSLYVPNLVGQLPLLSGLNGVNVSYNAASGKTTISLGTAQGELPLAGGGSVDSGAEWSVDGYDAGLLLNDVLGKVWAAGLLDGRFYVPKLLVGSLETQGGVVGAMEPSLDTSEAMYAVKTISSHQQIVRLSKSAGVQTQLTTLGNNTAPFLLSDGTGFGYSTDRSGPVEQLWQPLGGGAETLMVSSSALALLGDSRAFGLLAYMQAGNPTRTVIGQGGSGQKSPEIAARWTGGPVQVTISGGSIPASGAVNVTALVPDVFWHWDDALGAIHCVIAGVPGTLTFDNAATPKNTFVRDTAGAAVGVSTPVNATLDSGRVLGSTSAAGAATLAALRQMTAIIAPGYNDLAVGFFGSGFTYSRAGLLANVAGMIDAVPCKVKRFLTPNIYVGEAALVNGGGGLAAGQSVKGQAPDAATSKAFLDESFAYNAALQAAWPSHYVDMHGRLAVTYGQTATVLGTPYTILNRTFADDGIHAGNVGNLAKVAIYADELSQRGY